MLAYWYTCLTLTYSWYVNILIYLFYLDLLVDMLTYSYDILTVLPKLTHDILTYSYDILPLLPKFIHDMLTYSYDILPVFHRITHDVLLYSYDITYLDDISIRISPTCPVASVLQNSSCLITDIRVLYINLYLLDNIIISYLYTIYFIYLSIQAQITGIQLYWCDILSREKR